MRPIFCPKKATQAPFHIRSVHQLPSSPELLNIYFLFSVKQPFVTDFSLCRCVSRRKRAGSSPVTQRQQRDREQQTLLKSISILGTTCHGSVAPSQAFTPQFDPWQVAPRQVFTPHPRPLTSTADVVSRVGCRAKYPFLFCFPVQRQNINEGGSTPVHCIFIISGLLHYFSTFSINIPD